MPPETPLPAGTDARRDTVVLFKGLSLYDTMRGLTDDLAAAFRARGLVVAEIDGIESGWKTRLSALLASGRIAFFYGMNGWGLATSFDLRPWCDDEGIPFVAHIFDHPLTIASRLVGVPQNVVYCLHDETYRGFLDDMLRLPGGRAIVPVGGPMEAAEGAAPAGRRSIAILFPGSGYASTSREPPWAALPPEEGKILDACFDLALADRARPLHATIAQVFRVFGIAVADWRAPWVAQAFTWIDTQVRVARRIEIVSALLDLPIQIHGQGWEQFARPGQAARFLPPADFRTIQGLMAQSRVVLNVMPTVPAAPHDRMFYSMMAGAVCLTDSNRWVARELRDGENVVVYGERPENLAERVAALIADPDRLDAVAAAGRAVTTARHTWLARVDAILAAVTEQQQRRAA